MKLFDMIYNMIADTEDVKCNCKRQKDQDIESAASMKEAEAFIFYLDKKKIKYLQCSTFDTDFFIKIKGNDVKVSVGYRRFYKNSCLTCGTCLGWETGTYGGKVDLDEYFDNIIDNEIDKINRKQKAKEICGDVNETMKPKVVLGKSSSRDLKKKCKSSISQAKKEARVWKKCLAL